MIDNPSKASEEPPYQSLLFKLTKYAIVGGVSNGLLYLLYIGFTYLVTLQPVVASSLVFFIGIGVTYLGNAFWAFDRKKTHAHTMPRYIACYFFGYLVQIGTLAALTELLGLPHLFAQLVGMGGAAVTIFLLLNFWVFKNQKPS